MLTLLSPAKKLLNTAAPYDGATSPCLFAEMTQSLVQLMQKKSVQEIATLMDLSEDLATLNYTRYQNFSHTPESPALFLFQGDVYQGLQASSWGQDAIEYAQAHLRILSGLYGILHPLDLIHPYRLEMGVRLANPAGKNLYDFWQNVVTQGLNEQLSTQKNPLVLNLASTEYFKVINEKKLDYPVVTINFYEQKNNQLKMIGVHAKKARGVMARFIMQNQIDELAHCMEFNELGYHYHPATSSPQHLDFIRGS